MTAFKTICAAVLFLSVAACDHAPDIAGSLAGAEPASNAPSADIAQDDQTVLRARFNSFMAAGYDALTAPVDWYAPQETVRGVSPFAAQRVAKTTQIASTALDKAANWAENQNSTALLVMHNGALVYERYWHGDGRHTRFNPQSMSKTIVALLVGMAIERGEIGAVTDPIGKYLPELEGDPKATIPLHDLLQMSGGLAQLNGDYGFQMVLENPGVQQHFGADFIAPVLSLDVADPPGTKWEYNNNETNLMGYLLEKVSGKRYADLLSERLWKPLGLGNAALYLDSPNGRPMYSCCIFSRPIDWLIIGEFLRKKGDTRRGWHTEYQWVPEGWIDAMLTPSDTYRGYGYFTWLGDQNIGEGEPPFPGLIPWQSEAFVDPGTIILHGHGSQRVWILPAYDLVIVRAGRQWPSAWDESKLPNLIARGLTQP